MTTLDAATKEANCRVYRNLFEPFTSGVFDVEKVKEGAKFVADDIVYNNGGLPLIKGKDDFLKSFEGFSAIKVLVHTPDTIFCTNDGWVTCIGSFAGSGVKADGVTPFGWCDKYCNRALIVDGKVKELHSCYDLDKIMQVMI
mmetsp:Transcript_815/g.1279  ORF Transcript_815/g.1279 Transcript_815/m.1279 type:complete len:142 (+) Transcript_815:33-458(+)